MEFLISNPEDFSILNSFLHNQINEGDIVGLIGDLGAGKTTFVKSYAEKLGIDKNSVTSPTYSLCNYYPGLSISIAHWDLYRTKGQVDPSQILEYKEEKGWITFVEWPIFETKFLIPIDHILKIEYISPTERKFIYESCN